MLSKKNISSVIPSDKRCRVSHKEINPAIDRKEAADIQSAVVAIPFVSGLTPSHKFTSRCGFRPDGNSYIHCEGYLTKR